MPVTAVNDDYFYSNREPVPPLTDEKPTNPWKVVGLTVLGLGALASVAAAAIWWWRKRTATTEDTGTIDGITPSRGPRPAPAPTPGRAKAPSHQFVGTAELDPELREVLETNFSNAWPPDAETIDSLTQDDVIVFAAEGVPTGNYTEPRQELITGQVLSVETTIVRARVKGPVMYSGHFGSHPGHGLDAGESVEVPRSKVLVAARQKQDVPKPTGYDSQGTSVAQFKPTTQTSKVYPIKPGTPYDLILPYRTDRLVWQVQSKNNLVEMIHVGQKGPLEQVKFTEGSLRGPFTVVVLTDDPKQGLVFVARWDFDLQA